MRHDRARRSSASLACALALLAAACSKHEFEPPSRVERVSQADSLLSVETFDTIAWPNDSARSFAGNNAYAAHCRSCHGYLGDGATDYAREHHIDVPSIVRTDWPYQDTDELRRRIFIGHAAGMPTWGVAGITPREIDAAAYYLRNVLRPEVLGRR